MQITELFEGYKKHHKCKTPDAIFTTRIQDHKVTVSVKLPKHIELPESEQELTDLEADLHYAVEKVLAKFF